MRPPSNPVTRPADDDPTGAVRYELVEKIREQIADGSYATKAKLSSVADELMDQLEERGRLDP